MGGGKMNPPGNTRQDRELELKFGTGDNLHLSICGILVAAIRMVFLFLHYSQSFQILSNLRERLQYFLVERLYNRNLTMSYDRWKILDSGGKSIKKEAGGEPASRIFSEHR
jgi:hypothetical protein